jgi:hypothetical protein
MEKGLNVLHISRRMMMEVKTNSKAEVNFVKLTTPAAATPDQPESASFNRRLERERQRLRSRWERIIVSGTIAAVVLAVALAAGYEPFVIPGTAVVAVKKDDNTSTSVATVKKNDDRPTSVAAVKEDNDTSIGVAADKKDDDRSTSVAAVKEDNNTSIGVAAVKKDDDTSTGGQRG